VWVAQLLVLTGKFVECQDIHAISSFLCTHRFFSCLLSGIISVHASFDIVHKFGYTLSTMSDESIPRQLRDDYKHTSFYLMLKNSSRVALKSLI
jgi:hypothetical protein